MYFVTLQAEGADKETDENHDEGINKGRTEVGGHIAIEFYNTFNVQTLKTANGGRYKVFYKPAGNNRIEHHKQIVADHGGVTVNMPLGTFGLQLLI